MKLASLLLLCWMCCAQTPVGNARIRYSRLGNHGSLPARGLGVAYQLDEASGSTLNDRSPNGNHQSGTISWTAAGISLGGATAYSIASPTGLWAGAGSVMAAIMTTAPASSRTAFAFGSSAPVTVEWVAGSTSHEVEMRGVSMGTAAANASTWYVVGGTNDGAASNGNYFAYRNGVVVGGSKSGTGSATPINNLIVGGRSSDLAARWIGGIGLIHGWSRQLTPAEVWRSYMVYRRIMARRGVSLP